MQGIISGLALTAGYGIGVIGQWLWTFFAMPKPRGRVRHIITMTAAGVCLLAAVVFLWQASDWQNELRTMMGLERSAVTRPLAIGAVTAGVFMVLLMVIRLFKWTFQWLSLKLRPYVPRRISYLVGLIAAFLIFGLAVNGVLFSLILQAADASYKEWDERIQPDLEKPADPLKAGSKASLLAWDDLGNEGRKYVTESPDSTDIKRFTDQPVRQPIRIYIGMHAADSFEDRAQMALQELKRVNAFERSVLVLVTPTGSGWVSSAAIDPLEYLYRGDVASVAAQYSYLPSALSLLLEGEYGVEMARALFQKVYGYWTTLPEDNRPQLYLQGLSLGALNSDRSFDFFDIINDPFDGALWSGPPFRSTTWQEVTQRRKPGSPAWLPQFRDDAVVRFANSNGGLGQGEAPWSDFRIAYLQYASDPIVFFELQSWRSEPQWMVQPRGPGVNEDLEWYPIVTMLQLIADMLVSTSAPTGYGHEYAAVDYLQSWMELTEPEGWGRKEYQELRSFFRNREYN